MLHLCRTKNKWPILAVNRRPVGKGRKIASDKLSFLYAFAIITINKWLALQYTLYKLHPQIRKEFITRWFLL